MSVKTMAAELSFNKKLSQRDRSTAAWVSFGQMFELKKRVWCILGAIFAVELNGNWLRHLGMQ